MAAGNRHAPTPEIQPGISPILCLDFCSYVELTEPSRYSAAAPRTSRLPARSSELESGRCRGACGRMEQQGMARTEWPEKLSWRRDVMPRCSHIVRPIPRTGPAVRLLVSGLHSWLREPDIADVSRNSGAIHSTKQFVTRRAAEPRGCDVPPLAIEGATLRRSVCGHVRHVLESRKAVFRLGHDWKVEATLRTWLCQRFLFAIQTSGAQQAEVAQPSSVRPAEAVEHEGVFPVAFRAVGLHVAGGLLREETRPSRRPSVHDGMKRGVITGRTSPSSLPGIART